MSLSQQYRVLLAQELKSLFRQPDLPKSITAYSSVDIVSMSSDDLRKMYFTVKDFRRELKPAQQSRLYIHLQKVEDAVLQTMEGWGV